MRKYNCRTAKVLRALEESSSLYIEIQYKKIDKRKSDAVAFKSYIKKHYLEHKFIVMCNKNKLRIVEIDKLGFKSYDKAVSYLTCMKW